MAMRASSILRVAVPAAMVIWIVWALLVGQGDEHLDDPPGADARDAAGSSGSVGPLLQAGGSTAEGQAVPPTADGVHVAPQAIVPTCRVTVLLPGGAPAAQARVSCHPRGLNGLIVVQTDERGVAELPGLDPARRCRLEVHPIRHRSDALPFEDQDWVPQDQTIRLEIGLRITGHVVDEHGRPATDHGLFCRVPARLDSSWRVPLDERGVFQITHLPAGPVEVCAVFSSPWNPRPPEGFHLGHAAAGVALRTIEAGTSGVVLRVTRGAALRLVIQDWQHKAMPNGRTVTLQSMEGGASHTATLDYHGRVAFKGLAPDGRYRATLFGLPDNLMLDARELAPMDDDQKVRLSTGCRLSGRLFAPGVPGDRLRVFAVRGTLKFEGIVDERTGDFSFEGLPLGRWQVQASAVVLRDGRALTLRASGEMECGGRLELTLSGD